MSDTYRRVISFFLFVLAGFGGVALAAYDEEPWGPTPPRLSLIDGEVSYWRQGADDWAQARPNLALSRGDALYAGNDANFEVQFGRLSFVRADENSLLSLVDNEERRIQFKVSSGRVSFDLRGMARGDALEVSTPYAVFVIEQPGYYRVEVGGRETHFITRRGGEAVLTTADGRSLVVYSSEDIVVTAGDPVKVATYAAPPPDAWDRWNAARGDRFGESISNRYLSPDIYGAEELDHYGRWRVLPEYGAVWIPDGVGNDWAPYSTGSWVWDPYYEWSWVDDAPWGWAPFHYGRWVFIDGVWAWAPGPVARRAMYSPALVAFMIRGGDFSIGINFGLPGLWWVALSWGEPVLPWWGRQEYRGVPRWAGWGGPRIVNGNVLGSNVTVNAAKIRFHNAGVPRAVMTLPADKFGRERVHGSRETRYQATDFSAVRGELPVKPGRESLFGGARKGAQPPKDIVARPVVSTRAPRETMPSPRGEATRPPAVPESRYVVPPKVRGQDTRAPQRPPYGAEAGQERTPPPPPPRYGEVKRPAAVPIPPPGRDLNGARESGPGREPAAGRAPSVGREPPAGRETVTREPSAIPRDPTAREPSAPRESGGTQGPGPRGEGVERPKSVPMPAPPASNGQPGARMPSERAAPFERPAPPRGGNAEARGEERVERSERALPGRPANQVYPGREREPRDFR